ncbi:sterol-4-alpha-carboxylate 3-dehydrogenase (decarboxylating) [Saccharomycopsis crataegensis]|uniref:Sterol-4-alpha-carboxylate 3-dehydrogenase ERG26, decarboxylating n=1 Tax=Saccharomycopsis crataegensis TaxID=43959 RepID=A0AAV5QSH2_9ASCO|nr:sterol-4-alpha-carboxylate 3-dehydrogenase (decarboxylating) [Saccharomycopsis crataegensis]
MSSPQIKSVLLVGGSGFLGLHLVQEFYDISPVRPKIHVFDVRPLPEKLASYFTFDPKEIGFIKGDITSEESVKSAIRESGCDVVVHSASPIHGQKQEIYEKVNVEGTKNLIKCSADLKVKALVYTSSAGVIFNGQDIHNADESWPIPEIPMDGYNETKAIAEKAVLDANDFDSDFLTVALRPAGIFGPGDRQLVPGLRSVAKLGQSKFQIGDNNNLFDWTYAGNVAYAHVLAAQKLLDPETKHQVGGEKFFVTNDAPTYFWTLARTVWKADGHIDNFNIVLSRPVAIAIGYVSEFVSKLTGKEPGLTPFRVKVVCAYRYHNIAKAKSILGYKPKTGLEEGIKYTLDWMNETQ